MSALRRLGEERGAASVELVGALPFLVVVAALVWQLQVTVAASNAVANAARTAARVQSLGGDPVRAAQAALPPRQRATARIRVRGDRVSISTRTPIVSSSYTFDYVVSAEAEIPSGS